MTSAPKRKGTPGDDGRLRPAGQPVILVVLVGMLLALVLFLLIDSLKQDR
jgi:hypothetical protein